MLSDETAGLEKRRSLGSENETGQGSCENTHYSPGPNTSYFLAAIRRKREQKGGHRAGAHLALPAKRFPQTGDGTKGESSGRRMRGSLP